MQMAGFHLTLCLHCVTCSGDTPRGLMGCLLSGNCLHVVTVRSRYCGVEMLSNALSSKCPEISETLGRFDSILGREPMGGNVSGYLAPDSAEENLGRTPELLLFQLPTPPAQTLQIKPLLSAASLGCCAPSCLQPLPPSAQLVVSV